MPVEKAVLMALLMMLLCFLFGGLLINGLCMMLSPQHWFDLPVWFRGGAALNTAKYCSGWRAFQVRIAGIGMLAIEFFMFFSMVRNHM